MFLWLLLIGKFLKRSKVWGTVKYVMGKKNIKSLRKNN